MKIQSRLERILRRWPGAYILIVIGLAQLIAVPGAILGIMSIQINADYSSLQLQQSAWATSILVLLGNIILLFIAASLTPTARLLLAQRIRNNEEAGNPEQAMRAWQEITSLPWRYGVIALPLAFTLEIVLSAVYFYRVGLSNFDQMVYSMLGGFVSVVFVVILAVVAIETLLLPARQALLPSGIDEQLSALRGATISQKLLTISLSLIVIGILMVAPIGYHQIGRATINIFDPEQILRTLQIRRELQIQSLAVSFATILLGLGLTYAISRSLTRPISEMIETFRAVEAGNLNRRANVEATDEIGTLAIHFNRMVSRLEALQTSLETQVKERTEQLEAINEVGRAVSAILDPEELIEKVVNLITDRFGYYYAALFIVDSTGRWAELRSATGQAGLVLKEAHHRLEIGGKSMVGTAIQNKSARIALDVGAESVRFDNPLLPYTRSEIALPLAVGEIVLGALDVQSTKASAFDQSNIETLQNMANQVAVALENARLFQETRARLEELQASQRQYLQRAWASIESQEQSAYEVGESSRGQSRIEVPLTLRDQSIGEISLVGDANWSTEEHAWVEAVATQAAVALENARLLDQSQKTAAYEKLVADISAKIWSSTTIDGILQTSVRELGRALNATEAVIELGTDEINGATQ